MQLKDTKAAAMELLSELPIKKPRKLKRSDITLIVLSFICALFLWAYIASNIASEVTPQFRDLPITVDTTNTQAERLGLMLLPESAEELQTLTVTCTVYGNRAAIGGLTRSDLEAYVDFDSDIMDMTGVQTLPVKIRTKNGAPFTKADITPSRVSVNMDHYTRKEVPVTDAEHPNLSTNEEAIIREENITYSPAKVEVSGPSKQLAALDHICVNINDTEDLLESKTFDSSEYTFMDAEDKPVNGAAFETNVGLFSVTIPVVYSRTLPISVEIVNVPDGFDVSTIYKRLSIVGSSKNYSLPGYGEDNMQITIETPHLDYKQSLDDLNSYNTYSIALSDLIPGKTVTRSFPAAEGFESPDNITSVTFKLDDADLQTETRLIKNSDIELPNTNDRFAYDLRSPDGNTQVTLCGTAEELAMVDSDDLKAYVNLISKTEKGNTAVKINVTLPDTVSGVWVQKPPSLALNIKAAE